MKLISRTVHGVLDYAMALLLVSGPYLFGFAGDDLPSLVLYLAGGALFIYSLATNYELGLFKIIPMKVHLVLDVISGIFLAASPWLFGFADQVFLPHFILGITEILAAILTSDTKKESNRLI